MKGLDSFQLYCISDSYAEIRVNGRVTANCSPFVIPGF
jgi:hypothetical protein